MRPHEVRVKMVDCGLKVHEFKLQFPNYVHFQRNTLGVELSYFPQICVRHSCSSIRMEWAVNNPQRLICHSTKKLKPFIYLPNPSPTCRMRHKDTVLSRVNRVWIQFFPLREWLLNQGSITQHALRWVENRSIHAFLKHVSLKWKLNSPLQYLNTGYFDDNRYGNLASI